MDDSTDWGAQLIDLHSAVLRTTSERGKKPNSFTGTTMRWNSPNKVEVQTAERWPRPRPLESQHIDQYLLMKGFSSELLIRKTITPRRRVFEINESLKSEAGSEVFLHFFDSADKSVL